MIIIDVNFHLRFEFRDLKLKMKMKDEEVCDDDKGEVRMRKEFSMFNSAVSRVRREWFDQFVRYEIEIRRRKTVIIVFFLIHSTDSKSHNVATFEHAKQFEWHKEKILWQSLSDFECRLKSDGSEEANGNHQKCEDENFSSCIEHRKSSRTWSSMLKTQQRQF